MNHFQTIDVIARGSQASGAKLLCYENFVWWHLIFVGL